jgi:hypothetical protein
LKCCIPHCRSYSCAVLWRGEAILPGGQMREPGTRHCRKPKHLSGSVRSISVMHTLGIIPIAPGANAPGRDIPDRSQNGNPTLPGNEQAPQRKGAMAGARQPGPSGRQVRRRPRPRLRPRRLRRLRRHNRLPDSLQRPRKSPQDKALYCDGVFRMPNGSPSVPTPGR